MYICETVHISVGAFSSEGVRSPRARVTSTDESSDVGAGNGTQVLYKRVMCF